MDKRLTLLLAFAAAAAVAADEPAPAKPEAPVLTTQTIPAFFSQNPAFKIIDYNEDDGEHRAVLYLGMAAVQMQSDPQKFSSLQGAALIKALLDNGACYYDIVVPGGAPIAGYQIFDKDTHSCLLQTHFQTGLPLTHEEFDRDTHRCVSRTDFKMGIRQSEESFDAKTGHKTAVSHFDVWGRSGDVIDLQGKHTEAAYEEFDSKTQRRTWADYCNGGVLNDPAPGIPARQVFDPQTGKLVAAASYLNGTLLKDLNADDIRAVAKKLTIEAEPSATPASQMARPHVHHGL